MARQGAQQLGRIERPPCHDGSTLAFSSRIALWRFAALCIRSSAADLAAARLLAQAEDHDDGVIGFHAQQAVEKALKAVLAASGLEIPRTHEHIAKGET